MPRKANLLTPLTTQIVGSYTKLTWMIDHRYTYRFDDTAWRIEEDAREQALQNAVCLSDHRLAPTADGIARESNKDSAGGCANISSARRRSTSLSISNHRVSLQSAA